MVEWIPTGHKLPLDMGDVLLMFPSNMAVGYCDSQGYFHVASGNDMYTDVGDDEEAPICWAELPAPPLWR